MTLLVPDKKKRVPVNEKSFEMLFNRYFLQAFRLGELTLYAPTTREEFINGYDSKMVGAKGCRELYLPYKAPEYSPKKDVFTFKITPHQHDILQSYPRDTAFYVVPTMRSLAELGEIQSFITSCKDFLVTCICIEISRMPSDLHSFRYIKPRTNRSSAQFKYKLRGEGRAYRYDVASGDWCRGSKLLETFRNHEVGSIVNFGDTNTPMRMRPVSYNFDVHSDYESLKESDPNLFRLMDSKSSLPTGACYRLDLI